MKKLQQIIFLTKNKKHNDLLYKVKRKLKYLNSSKEQRQLMNFFNKREYDKVIE